MSVRTILAMTLLSLAFHAEAREVRMAGAGGDGAGCSGDYPTSAAPDIDPARATRRPEAEKAVTPRGADPDAARPPRWHSFLPGMFR